MTARVYVIAGPNGAGKTYVRARVSGELRALPNFVNATGSRRVFRLLRPNAIVAGMLMLEEIEACWAKPGFWIRDTLAGRGHLNLIRNLKSRG